MYIGNILLLKADKFWKLMPSYILVTAQLALPITDMILLLITITKHFSKHFYLLRYR